MSASHGAPGPLAWTPCNLDHAHDSPHGGCEVAGAALAAAQGRAAELEQRIEAALTRAACLEVEAHGFSLGEAIRGGPFDGAPAFDLAMAKSRAIRDALSPSASPSAPAPVPEDVKRRAQELADAWNDEDTREAHDALLSAITRALADAREGALGEAADAAEAMEDEMFDRYSDECRSAGVAPGARGEDPAVNVSGAIADRIRALASPPPTHEEGGR